MTRRGKRRQLDPLSKLISLTLAELDRLMPEIEADYVAFLTCKNTTIEVTTKHDPTVGDRTEMITAVSHKGEVAWEATIEVRATHLGDRKVYKVIMNGGEDLLTLAPMKNGLFVGGSSQADIDRVREGYAKLAKKLIDHLVNDS